MSKPGRQAPGGTGPEGTGDFTAARRGDLVVIHLHHVSWADRKKREYDEFTAGRVTTATRDGTARLYNPAGILPGAADRLGRPVPGLEVRGDPGFQQAWIKNAGAVDVDGALATAACNTLPGSETTIRGYGSLEEIRAALRPHDRSQPGWEQLHAAALSWQASRATAEALLDRGWDAYEEAVAAANSFYRHACAAVAAGLPVPAPAAGQAAAPPPARHLTAFPGPGQQSWFAVHSEERLARLRADAARAGVPLTEGELPDLSGAPAALLKLRGRALAAGLDVQVTLRPSPAGTGASWSLSAAAPSTVVTAAWDNGKRAPGDVRAHGSLQHLMDAISTAACRLPAAAPEEPGP